MTTNIDHQKTAGEIGASLTKITLLLARMDNLIALTENGPILRRTRHMKAAEIKNVLKMARQEAASQPDIVTEVNIQAEWIELNVDTLEYMRGVGLRFQEISKTLAILDAILSAPVEEKALETFHEAKRLSREPGNEHLIPVVQEMQRTIRGGRTEGQKNGKRKRGPLERRLPSGLSGGLPPPSAGRREGGPPPG